ncbi:helix-turn-helix domain-containing protein [Deinococcus humi]|uniref:Excisionase family DNA binding protein n=1 Tax=Deinococcus humi TaxID=662880 RepID=A0A7W8JV66_9DEIO|nr:helix-turn-helix domain-containing protein [Deinococcus humi]MBB5363535.1 excisionase family DNA binding protein [Deinococcus humi]GGO30337.1 hypothetical protein GCM10008949_25080 [Deinococcus humi]
MYTILEVAQMARVTDRTIRNHIRLGLLHARHLGRAVCIADTNLLAYLSR